MNVILNFSMRVRVAGAGDMGVIAAKDQRIYFNCGCVLLVRAEYELAFIRIAVIIRILSGEVGDCDSL